MAGNWRQRVVCPGSANKNRPPSSTTFNGQRVVETRRAKRNMGTPTARCASRASCSFGRSSTVTTSTSTAEIDGYRWCSSAFPGPVAAEEGTSCSFHQKFETGDEVGSRPSFVVDSPQQDWDWDWHSLIRSFPPGGRSVFSCSTCRWKTSGWTCTISTRTTPRSRYINESNGIRNNCKALLFLPSLAFFSLDRLPPILVLGE